MQRMALILLSERAPSNAKILVVGAGGGLELTAFARARPDWHFVGIDPSAEMLNLAKMTLGSLISQVELYEGYVDSAPPHLVDGATCLLVLHFLDVDERLRTLQEIRKRLKPGAPFVIVHHSFAEELDQQHRWLSRFAAFATSSGIERAKAEESVRFISEQLPVINPDREEDLLARAGFRNIATFYAAFTFRGWVAYA